MATRKNVALIFLVLTAAVAVLLHGTEAATQYTVGNSTGWAVPSGGAAFYTSWASNHNFSVGDTLVFIFVTGSHDLATVSKSAFDACNLTNTLTLTNSGPVNFTLNSTGDYYFFCTFPQHCLSGQKLAINVKAASGTSPGSSSSPPPPSGSGSPPPPPPPAGSASSLAATFSVVLMTITLTMSYLF